MEKKQRLSTFAKQCFVTSGVTLNFLQMGLVLGFPSSLLPQLRGEDSTILIDDSSGSWIAAIPTVSMFPTIFITPFLIGKCGRKLSSIISVVPLVISWLLVATATNLTMILIARLMQGVSLSIADNLSPILIGEYTSPSNRGAFLTTLSLVIALGTLMAHAMAAYLHWQTTAIVCGVLAFVDLIIVVYSPESPSWLIDKGRYEDGSKVFRWLRGDDEDGELKKMIEANTALNETKLQVTRKPTAIRLKSNIVYFNTVMRKPEFYKPILIVLHSNILILVSGSLMLASYGIDAYSIILGTAVNVPLVLLSSDIQRLICNTCAIYVIKMVKRRIVLITTVALNIFALIITAGYSYAKSKNLIQGNPYIGVSLVHIHMFSIAVGTTPIPLIIPGEIFPLRYRSLAIMISSSVNSPITFVIMKTFPFLLNAGGLHGVYCIYACMVLYAATVTWIFLPETKDKTLLDIEDEFRGKTLAAESECDEAVKLRGNPTIL